MEVKEIERMLAEFYEGNTNEQEEELLKEAFKTEELPEHLRKERKLFLGLFPEEAMEDVPAGLEDKLKRMIDEKAEEEQRFFRRNKAKRNWRWIGGIDDTILILLGKGNVITNMLEG
ncbi:MAG: hypothetical protein K2I11_02215, partial [Bacteroides sp.]|nr:hypothetical protein [Bacteroides sp.]